MFKELQCDRGHSREEEHVTVNDGEVEIVQVNDGARMDLDMACGADTMNEKRSECDESDGSGSDHSSVDCDNKNPFKG